MKKLCEKHSLLVGALITLFIAIILSWIFPEAYYSNGKLGLSYAEKFGLFASTANDTRVGLFDITTYGQLVIYYFTTIFVFAFVLSTILLNPLGDLDEIWNYNVARNIAKGLIPYKDISTITTPLMPMINSIFLKIFGDELIVMRVLAAILGTSILYTIFKLFKKLTNEVNISLIITFSIGLLLQDIYCIDYNYLVLFITLIITYLELKNKKNNTKFKEMLQGVLAGLAICTKQSTGFFVAIAVIIYPLTKIKQKEEIKKNLKDILIRICGIAIPRNYIYDIFNNNRSME